MKNITIDDLSFLALEDAKKLIGEKIKNISAHENLLLLEFENGLTFKISGCGCSGETSLDMEVI